MSHISKVETQLKDMAILQKTLTSLGYEYECAKENQKIQVKAYNKDTIDADMEIKILGPYGIAVNRTKNGLELSADWWEVETYTERKQEDFLSEIQKQYAYETVMDKIKADGYSIVTENQDQEENLHIVVRRWV